MFDPADPRSSLPTVPTAAGDRHTPADAQLFAFQALEPDEKDAHGAPTWMVRSQNAVLAYSQARPGTSFARTDQPDEFVVLFPASRSEAVITTPSQRVLVSGEAVVVMPPGSSHIAVGSECEVIRLYSTRSADLADRCRNALAYATGAPNVTPYRPWASPDADAVRVHSPAAVAPDPNRFGRIYRTSTMMVNVFEPEDGPRSPERLSPHHHEDFEQISLQLAGDYVHHLRTPWGTRLADWRDDQHLAATSPAVLIIPPPVTHTSQAVGEHAHRLVDIFCPPRHDFAQQGWVLNDDDYPSFPAPVAPT